jgi:hypothetical protein
MPQGRTQYGVTTQDFLTKDETMPFREKGIFREYFLTLMSRVSSNRQRRKRRPTMTLALTALECLACKLYYAEVSSYRFAQLAGTQCDRRERDRICRISGKSVDEIDFSSSVTHTFTVEQFVEYGRELLLEEVFYDVEENKKELSLREMECILRYFAEIWHFYNDQIDDPPRHEDATIPVGADHDVLLEDDFDSEDREDRNASHDAVIDRG